MATKADLSDWKIAKTSKMVSYGFAYVVVNYLLLYGVAQMDFFYRNAIGLGANLILASTVIFAIWNMANDPILGFVTDKPRKWTKKWGLRAPWVFITTIPMLIFFVLIWTPPIGADQMTIFVYMIVITCIFDTFFSIYNDHIYGGYTNQFPTEYERRRGFAIMTIMLFSILIVMSVITSLVLGGNEDQPGAYLTNALIMTVLLVIFSVPVLLGVKESENMKAMFIETYESAENAGFWKTTKTAMNQKNFVVSMIGYTIQVTATQLFNGAQLYFFVDVYGLPISSNVLPQLLGILAVLGSIPFWSNYTRKHDFKATYWLAFVLHGLAFLPFMLMVLIAPTGLAIVFHTIFFFIMMIPYAGEVTMLMPVASDTYDSVALQMGRRQDATFVGLRNFFFRVAFLVQAIVYWLFLSILTDYKTTEQQAEISNFTGQSASAQFGILIMGALIPCILFVCMGLIFKKFYTLVGDEKEEMINKLKEAGLFRS